MATTSRTIVPLALAIGATIAFATTLAGTIVAADLGFADPLLRLLHIVPMADECVHFVMYGGLCLLAIITLSRSRISRHRWIAPLIVVLTFALATGEEASQLWFPSRTFSIADLIFSYAGILFFGVWVCLRLGGFTQTPIEPTS